MVIFSVRRMMDYCALAGALRCAYAVLFSVGAARAAERLRSRPRPSGGDDPEASKRRQALAARLGLWALCGAFVLGLPIELYFCLWSLNSRPVAWLLLRRVALVEGVELLVLALCASWLLRGGAAALIEVVLETVDRGILGRAGTVADVLAPLLKPGSRVLDVGACDGGVLQRLRERLSISPVAIDVAPMTMGDIPVQAYDGLTIPLADKAVDAALCVCTLHHCEDSAHVLKEIARVTTGRLVIIEDAYDTLLDRAVAQAAHAVHLALFGLSWDVHGFRSRRQWESALREAGFQVEACERFWLYPLRGLPVLGGLPFPSCLIVAIPDPR